VVGDMLRKINDTDYFSDLISQLSEVDYIENQNLFIFPYDWRRDLFLTADLLSNKIENIKFQTGAEKVDLVVHSMGGLVAKEYIKKYGAKSIGKLIDIATPHTGSPSSFKILSYGDNLGVSKFFGVIGFYAPEIKDITQNMPSVYELLPSRNYFSSTDSNYKYYVYNGLNKSEKLNFDETNDYLKSEGRNSSLVDRADVFHQEVDGLNPADYGVKTYNIVGCGTPTMGQIYILDKEGEKYSYDIKMINGDGTVPLRSAEALPAEKTYYIKGAKHATMPSMAGVKELVTSILTNTEIPTLSNVFTSPDNCTIPNGKIVSFHSPITLNAYDESGNHSGPNNDGDIENNIPGADYEVLGDNKFVYLPDGPSYTINGEATDEGSFDVRIESIIDEEIATTTIFNDIPLSKITRTEFVLNSNIPEKILLDKDGDGVYESTFDSSLVTSGFIESTGETKKSETSQSNISNTIALSGSHSHPTVATMALKPVDILEKVLIKPDTNLAKKTIITSVSTKQTAGIKNATTTPEVKIQITSDNTAVVYKSFGRSLINLLKNLWSWIKSLI